MTDHLRNLTIILISAMAVFARPCLADPNSPDPNSKPAPAADVNSIKDVNSAPAKVAADVNKPAITPQPVAKAEVNEPNKVAKPAQAPAEPNTPATVISKPSAPGPNEPNLPAAKTEPNAPTPVAQAPCPNTPPASAPAPAAVKTISDSNTPPAVKLPAKIEPNETNIRQAKLWSLACSAMLIEILGGSHEDLGACDSDRVQARCRYVLLKEYGIRTRAELLKVLATIEDRGSRTRFDTLGKSLGELDEKLFNEFIAEIKMDTKRVHMVKIARRYYKDLGPRSLIGWDYGRYIALCRWGFATGYLSQDEAWTRILAAAKIIKSSFSSWSQLGENYLVGLAFWSYRDLQANSRIIEDAYWRLVDMPQSPWNTLPWNTDLAILDANSSPAPAVAGGQAK